MSLAPNINLGSEHQYWLRTSIWAPDIKNWLSALPKTLHGLIETRPTDARTDRQNRQGRHVRRVPRLRGTGHAARVGTGTPRTGVHRVVHSRLY